MSNDIRSSIENLSKRVESLEKKLPYELNKFSLNVIRQLECFYQLHSLVGDIPGDLHGWPLSADISLFLVRLVLKNKYSLVIEFGSGTSSFILLEALSRAFPSSISRTSPPQMLVFEHLEKFFVQTSELIECCSLRSHCSIILSPLKVWEDASGHYLYYSNTEAIQSAVISLRRKRKYPLKKILVLVDGPPGVTGRWARYPALPVLLASLGDCNVSIDLVMDDTLRDDEQETVQAWSELLKNHGVGHSQTILDFEKGATWLQIPTLMGYKPIAN